MSLFFCTHSSTKLALVVVVVIGGLLWMGGTDDVHAGGNGKGAVVETTYPDLDDCTPDEDASDRLCITHLGREHKVETPSGNTVTSGRVVDSFQVFDDDDVFFETTAIAKFNKLAKDGVVQTRRTHLFTRFTNPTVTNECETDTVVANGETRFDRMECETF